MTRECLEQILEDVVRVDAVLASECDFDIPPQITLTSMEENKNGVSRIGAPSLSVAFSLQDGDDGEMEDAPDLNRTPKTTKAGKVNILTLKVPITGGFKATEIAANLLHRKDFHVVLTTDGGARYLLYSLPNSSECLLTGQDIGKKDTLNISMLSASQLIELK